jgi:2'-5' RNA ligase
MDKLYFIAVIPPREIADEVTAFKQVFADQYQSKAALRSPAHITLVSPFKVGEAQYDDLLTWFSCLEPPVSKFGQELKDFGMFANKRPVIFINPILNGSLPALQKWVEEEAIAAKFVPPHSQPQRDFHPHMTVAFKDLLPHRFREAWPFFAQKSYDRMFEVSDIHLLQHDGKEWKSIANIRLPD